MAETLFQGKAGRALNSAINKECEKYIARGLTKLAKVGSVMMVDKRRQVIKEWFDEYDYIDLSASTRCDVQKKQYGYDFGEVIFTTYTDLEIYGNRKDADAWRERRRRSGEDYGSDESSKYVADLHYYKGIIGLPEYGKRRLKYPDNKEIGGGHVKDGHWINDNFVRRPETLIDVLNRELKDEKFLRSIIKAAGFTY